MKKKIFLSILFMGLIGASVGFYQFSKKVPGLEHTDADYSLSADQLFDAYNENESVAMTQYEGKVVAVSGRVSRIVMTDSTSNIILGAAHAIAGGINCAFNEPVTHINKGDSITVKGRCQGFLMDVVLNNCYTD